MNELLYGASNETLDEVIDWTFEIGIAVLLYFVFHYTGTWAVPLSGILFVLILLAVSKISSWLPDLRTYALAILLVFALEVWVKSAWQSLTAWLFPEPAATSTSTPPPPPANQPVTTGTNPP